MTEWDMQGWEMLLDAFDGIGVTAEPLRVLGPFASASASLLASLMRAKGLADSWTL